MHKPPITSELPQYIGVPPITTQFPYYRDPSHRLYSPLFIFKSYFLVPSVERSRGRSEEDGLLNAGGWPFCLRCHCAHEPATITIARDNAVRPAPKGSLVVMMMAVDHDYS